MNDQPSTAPAATNRQPRSYFSHYLPRLRRECYQADAVIFWTMPISGRAQGWLNDRFHASFREMMLHTAAREGLLCPAYCLMPDHVHLVWMGLRRDTDQAVPQAREVPASGTRSRADGAGTAATRV